MGGRLATLALIAAIAGGLSGCTAATEGEPAPADDARVLSLPTLASLEVDGRPLNVVATTSIIGDVVGRVGESAIVLTTLLDAGEDPHGYVATPADLSAAADADVIFVNGWNLEEGLLADLTAAAPRVLQVPVSAGIESRTIDAAAEPGETAAGEHAAGAPDPHTWLDPHLVITWVANIERTLQALDPGRTAAFSANAARYRAELDALVAEFDERLAPIAPADRKLVTNHDALGYFARAYGFEIVGTVLPGTSTLAEPSARELAMLAETMRREGVCAVFSESSMSAALAEVVAAELDACETVRVIPLYTGSLGAAGSGAETYAGMMRANLEAILSSYGG